MPRGVAGPGKLGRWKGITRLVTVFCERCETKFDRFKSQVRDRNFCSRKCALATVAEENTLPTLCHPGREHIGRGLCQQCYNEDAHLRRQGWREHYDRLFVEQHGVCAICEEPCSTGGRLSVDHDHLTGRVRGLLCRNCNSGIGMLCDDPSLLEKATAYLRKHGA